MSVSYRLVDGSPQNILEAAFKYTPCSWEQCFEDGKYEITDAVTIVTKNGAERNLRVLPDPDKVFRAFELTPVTFVKAVIVGQDPYHGYYTDYQGNRKPEACGLSFSIARDNKKIPPSLRNIFKEIKRTVPDFNTPTHGDLTNWALQGVLLLNASLTVLEGQPASHNGAWKGFIKRVVDEISKYNPKCIYVMWGREAQKLKSLLPKTAQILEWMHPSGFNANGFEGNDHFNQINQMLIADNKRPIDWNLD